MRVELISIEVGLSIHATFNSIGISKINADDHHEIKRAKNKLNQLLEQELDFLGFQDELTEEERADLLDSTMSEVREKSSFFYKYDANKVNTNKAI